MNEQLCQCCGMPMDQSGELYGTNADGSKNQEYCKYCYENGAILFQGTMEEMIEFCVPHMVEGSTNLTEEDARKMMKEFFPTLKYWKEKLAN